MKTRPAKPVTPAKATKPVEAPKAATKPAKAELPLISFETKRAFNAWLAKNHQTAGLWLRYAKKDSGVASITYQEAVDVALCWGWIDGQSKSIDATHYMQRFTPRGKKSIWSKINREKVARLVASGDMQPQGLAAVEAAKADGRWDAAYDSPRTATVPDDLLVLLGKHPKAKAFFETLNATNRYAILFRLQNAKKPETRARQLAKFVAMLERGEKIHP
jgi:uncharacterized protein YdeI (YjbR/CyaY-like superfamily)